MCDCKKSDSRNNYQKPINFHKYTFNLLIIKQMTIFYKKK
jgi:hypothetical protein